MLMAKPTMATAKASPITPEKKVVSGARGALSLEQKKNVSCFISDTHRNLFNNLETRQIKFYESQPVAVVYMYDINLLLWLVFTPRCFMASVGKPGFFHNRSLQETRCYTHTSLQIVWQSYQQILDFWQKWKGRKFCALGLLQHFISTQRWAYPLGISPTTSMLYLLGSSQKCVMIVAAMTCWLKKTMSLQYH